MTRTKSDEWRWRVMMDGWLEVFGWEMVNANVTKAPTLYC